MTATRARLLVLKGAADRADGWLDSGPLNAIQSAFEIVEVENAAEAQSLLDAAEPGSVLVGEDLARLLLNEEATAVSPARLALQQIGEGVGMVDETGRLVWANHRLREHDDETRGRFVELCGRAIEVFGRMASKRSTPRLSHKFTFMSGDATYELVVSTAETDGDAVRSVVGVLCDISATRRLQQKIDAIDAAGSELMRIETQAIQKLDMAQRLRLLEEKIVNFVSDLLQFDNFEIRLLDRESERLELVVAVGLTPLKIGEVIYARPEGNGISGYVGAHRPESYICPRRPRKTPATVLGLQQLGKSSLTVPLHAVRRGHRRLQRRVRRHRSTPSTKTTASSSRSSAGTSRWR